MKELEEFILHYLPISVFIIEQHTLDQNCSFLQLTYNWKWESLKLSGDFFPIQEGFIIIGENKYLYNQESMKIPLCLYLLESI